jgi:hypothetical protein
MYATRTCVQVLPYGCSDVEQALIFVALYPPAIKFRHNSLVLRATVCAPQNVCMVTSAVSMQQVAPHMPLGLQDLLIRSGYIPHGNAMQFLDHIARRITLQFIQVTSKRSEHVM